MLNITINGQPITIAPGATILDAATQAGVTIPTMCHLAGHAAGESCFVCVVKVNGNERLLPACATRVSDGMVVESETPEVLAARRSALDLLLGDHLGDCIGPCQGICPAHMDIPAMIRHIAIGELREAIAVIKERIALPAVLGRICPELCEKGCRRGQMDSPVSICRLKRFAADADLASEQPYQPSCRPSTGKRVAIIGAGPAGLAAAYYLLCDGHACTLYDEHDRPGGMLRYAVPEDRLSRKVLDAEIDLIMQLGAQFRQNVQVDDAMLAQLRLDFDAVLLAVGSVTDADIFAECERSTHGLKVDRHTQQSNLSGVFLAGSVITPTQHAVRAVADGRAAAQAINALLNGESLSEHDRRPFSVHIGKLDADEMVAYTAGASETPRVNADDLTSEEAMMEAGRCLHCDCRKLDGCKLRDYAIIYGADPVRFKGERRRFAVDATHPDIVYEPGKCIACGICVRIASAAQEELGLAFIGRGFTVRVAAPFSESLADALRQTARACAEACPTGALVVKDDLNRGDAEAQRE